MSPSASICSAIGATSAPASSPAKGAVTPDVLASGELNLDFLGSGSTGVRPTARRLVPPLGTTFGVSEAGSANDERTYGLRLRDLVAWLVAGEFQGLFVTTTRPFPGLLPLVGFPGMLSKSGRFCLAVNCRIERRQAVGTPLVVFTQIRESVSVKKVYRQNLAINEIT